MNCKQYRTEIEEWDLTARKSAERSGSHAADCAECRLLGDETAALRGLVAGLARVDAPPDFEFRLRARMSAADSARARPWPRVLMPRAAWLAAAGCLALAAALALQTRTARTPVVLETGAQPGATQSTANTAAAEAANVVTRDLSDEKGGEKAGEMAASESSATTAAPNEAVVARHVARAASAAATNAVRTQQRKAATAAAQPVGETLASGGERTERTETNMSSMIGSAVIVSSAIPLPVSADERPLQVLFKDTQGASRVVNVDPIAFGSNEPAARPTNVTFTKAAKKQQGVW